MTLQSLEAKLLRSKEELIKILKLNIRLIKVSFENVKQEISVSTPVLITTLLLFLRRKVTVNDITHDKILNLKLNAEIKLLNF